MKKILFLPLLLTIFFFIISSLFKINIIHCQIGEDNCSPEFYQKLELLKGKSLFFTNFDKELNSQEIKSEPILIESYQKKIPGTIILNFSEEKALYQINFGENHYFVSEFGNILQSNQEILGLPQINWENNVGSLIENKSLNQKNHLPIAKIINITSENALQIESINWKNDDEIIIKIKDNPNIIADIKSINTKINVLGLLLDSKEIKDYDGTIKEIDLRFNLPVLRTIQ